MKVWIIITNVSAPRTWLVNNPGNGKQTAECCQMGKEE